MKAPRKKIKKALLVQLNLFDTVGSNPSFGGIRPSIALLAKLFFGIYVLLLQSACSLTKHVEQGAFFLDKATVQLEPTQIKDKETRQVVASLESRLSILANPALSRWRIRFYNLFGDPEKNRGIPSFLQDNIGKSPQVFHPKDTVMHLNQARKYLFDRGFFRSIVHSNVLIKDKIARLSYRVQTGDRYRIRDIHLPLDSSRFTQFLHPALDSNLSKYPGTYYDLENLKTIRELVVSVALENGYFAMSSDLIHLFVDTVPKTNLVDLYLTYEAPGDTLSFEFYRMGNTYIFPDFSLVSGTNVRQKDTLEYEGLFFIYAGQSEIEESFLASSIHQRKGNIYRRSENEKTVTHLTNLGFFSYVNQRLVPEKRKGINYLDRYLYLTPRMPAEIESGLSADTRTGNFLGMGANLTYKHKNLWRRLIGFSIGINGSLETQVGDRYGFINSSSANVQVSLAFPWLFPLKRPAESRSRSERIPSTQFLVGLNYQDREKFYTMASLNLRYGFRWRTAENQSHELHVVQVNRVDVLSKTPALETLLASNPFLRSSFEDLYIIGSQYRYDWATSAKRTQEAFSSFSLTLETSGNLSYALSRVINPEKKRSFRLLGNPYSQFFKLDVDIRHYLPIRGGKLAGRFFLGAALPYGNSSTLPYLKQYFSGGSAGIRAFRIRTLGPGNYQTAIDRSSEIEFIDQTGDCKLEFNLEYRFPVFSYVEGAFFMDGGNIWLLTQKDGVRQDGYFLVNEFLKEIALGTGIGLRAGFNTLVVRIDLAMPIRIPYLPDNERWVIDDIRINHRSWRKDNLVWNIALGYPF